jgi:glycosyltransferase involved in cell wall biosynthesis
MIDSKLAKIIEGKKVLFITPSDIDYIRNRQEIDILEQVAYKLDVIAPRSASGVKPTGIKQILTTGLKIIATNINRYDVIFIGGIPQLIMPLVKIRFPRAVLIIDFFISIYDTLVCDRKILSPANPLCLILKKLDRNALAGADHVIVDTFEHAAYFSGMFGVDRSKMTVVYLEADRRLYSPRIVERPHELRSKFIVFFFGAMNPLQGADVILDAARTLENHPNIVFILIGPYEKIKGFEQYRQLTNVRFPARWIPQEEIADYIAMSDVCLAGHFNAAVTKASRVIPGKAYSYLAMNRPVIFGENPANRELFPIAEKNVHFVKMSNPQALADKILALACALRRS